MLLATPQPARTRVLPAPRTRKIANGLRQERWVFTVQNHRGNRVAKGERWLISQLDEGTAARYLAGWWAEEGGRNPTAGWRIHARPAWRTRKATADIPQRWLYNANPDETIGFQPTGA